MPPTKNKLQRAARLCRTRLPILHVILLILNVSVVAAEAGPKPKPAKGNAHASQTEAPLEEVIPNPEDDPERASAAAMREFEHLDTGPAGPETKKELSIKREGNFEFASPPHVTRAGDRVQIDFETKAFCDATVAIETANGEIVRHLASGVLGSNAPAPFAKDSKKQELIWDGKNDKGEYLDNKDALTVRVSLGLRAQFEKVLHHDPKQRIGSWPIIRTAPEGVLVYNCPRNHVYDYLQLYDHDGNYVRTLHPFPADKLGGVKGLKTIMAWPEDRPIPVKSPPLFGSLLPFGTGLYDAMPNASDVSVRNGKITIYGCTRCIRLTFDGTSGGENFMSEVGPFCEGIKRVNKALPRRTAVSPDGKWVYMTRVYGYRPGYLGDESQLFSCSAHAVYRMKADASTAPELFIGDPNTPGNDNEHFHYPCGIAVDPQGRIYVTEWDNDRVQVFTPDGKYFKTIKVDAPGDIAINQKTGEIYVFRWRIRFKSSSYAADDGPRLDDPIYNSRGSPGKVLKFAPIDNFKPIYEAELKIAGLRPCGGLCDNCRAEVDAWSPRPRIWLVNADGDVQVLEEKDNQLTLIHDFDKECEAADVQPYGGKNPCPLQRQFLAVDSKRQVLYVGEPNENQVKYFNSVLAIDIATGKERIEKLPVLAADMDFDADGNMYLLDDRFIGRFEPDSWTEIPFDYGRELGNSARNSKNALVSTIENNGGHGSSYKHQSMAVSANGDIIVAGQCDEVSAKKSDRHNEATAGASTAKWIPTLYRGRPASNMSVNIFNRYGELIHKDVLAGAYPLCGGLGLDTQDNVYAAVRASRMLDGKRLGYNTGTLARFPATGAHLLTNDTHAMAPLEAPPAQPVPMVCETGKLWIEGADWLWGGPPEGMMYQNCYCRQSRFKLDWFARSFVSETWRYSVAVVDSAGNVMMRMGQYGNADSHGAKSMIPLGGDEIGIMDCQFVTVDTDRRVFIGDIANRRIVSALLTYNTTQKVPLKDIPDEAKQP